MPPQPTAAYLSQKESWTASTEFGHLFKVVLLLSIVTTAVRSLVVIVSRRKRRMSDSSSSQEKNSLPTPPALEKEPNQYLQSLKKETLQPDLAPVYPWTALPHALPGPYDAPYYPLPPPTIRRHSHDPSAAESEQTSRTIPYTRRVSTNSILNHEVVLEGSSTVSSQGWRRTQWTVSAG
ncbi:uncharacterized protein K460DRAFT_363259 [Cucurbitaria berberidis CBS 394.84]|uniref:Uncharacterized protein n=1 Tax=Cucurbitaria berberidis CBS 394.84 TaxID=1168544 RepID=A0A9P4GKZ3_9PLEO|nr:uncharacterized protein K460DRAFT_363259 [Cucurbitaria berberidis CBS 394.84]KAF1847152.1 hypothetical protein K460DRAFT_363259 [Cucurbitaria berberidis CBS 394.84]